MDQFLQKLLLERDFERLVKVLVNPALLIAPGLLLVWQAAPGIFFDLDAFKWFMICLVLSVLLIGTVVAVQLVTLSVYLIYRYAHEKNNKKLIELHTKYPAYAFFFTAVITNMTVGALLVDQQFIQSVKLEGLGEYLMMLSSWSVFSGSFSVVWGVQMLVGARRRERWAGIALCIVVFSLAYGLVYLMRNY